MGTLAKVAVAKRSMVMLATSAAANDK